MTDQPHRDGDRAAQPDVPLHDHADGDAGDDAVHPPVPATLSPPPRPRRRFPALVFSIGMFLLALLLMGVCSLLAFVVQDTLHEQFHLDTTEVEMSPLLLGLVNLVAISITCVVGALLTRRPWRELFPFRPMSGWLVVPVLLTLVGMSILSSEADNIVRTFLPMPEFVEDVYKGLVGNEEDALAAVWLLVLVAPLTEELLMRGLVLQTLLRRYSVATSIIISAILFASLHANPWQFVGPIAVGVLFAWWCVRSGSLWPGILGHALHNGSILASGVLGIEIVGYSVEPYDTPSFQPWWFDALGVVCLAAGLVLTVLVFRRQRELAGAAAVAGPAEAAGADVHREEPGDATL